MAFRPSTVTPLRLLAPTTRQVVRLRPASRPCFQRSVAVRPFSATSQSPAKKYTEEHEWIELGADGKIGTVGITTYAAKSLGDVVYVELPQVDQEVSAGDTIGAVESVKSASDILSPVAGRITEANATLEDKPGNINKSPEADGWIAKIEVEDVSALESLMDKTAYDDFSGEPDSD